MVGVAHRRCRLDGSVGKCQHRLSFSRAEIVIINSCSPAQQIVYHMLRHFIKIERLTDCGENKADTLSNYHIKTVFLWACELESRSWWTEDLNLVRICVELLQILSVWLTETRCQHYFINCNLLDNSFVLGSVTSKLQSVNEQYLSTWFINNYMVQCAQLCPVYITRLFDDVSSSVKLQNMLPEIVSWILNTSLDDSWRSFYFSEFIISENVSFRLLTPRLCTYWINELTKIDKRLTLLLSRCPATCCV